MNILRKKTYQEKFQEKFPVVNDVMLSIIEGMGIDINKYYFSSFSNWLKDDKQMYDVYYVCETEHGDVTLLVSVSMDGDTIQLEQFSLSTD